MSDAVEITYGKNDLGANTLLIIGNGFDLDLGLNTRYSDFASSKYWPFHGKICGLGGYLNRHKKSDKWFDLETSMARYCSKPFSRLLPNSLRDKMEQYDKRDDQTLVNSLNDYLASEFERVDKGHLFRNKSIAASLLKAICTTLVPGTIYTFNYTDLKAIASTLGPDVEVGCNPHYVHGKLSDQSIILGFNERPEIKEAYKYCVKSRRLRYTSTNLFNSLEKYDNIVFYGLSFGDIDSIYFSRFFSEIVNGHLPDKYVRIITKDNNSRQRIFVNLNNMTGNDFLLYKEANFAILTTDGASNKAINELLEHINL